MFPDNQQVNANALAILEHAQRVKEKVKTHRQATPEEILGQRWEPGDEPYNESLTIEKEGSEDNFPRIPSFRAVFLHKIRRIVQAFGGPTQASRELGVWPGTVNDWLNVDSMPPWPTMSKIDRFYELATEKLRFEAAKKNKGRKKQ